MSRFLVGDSIGAKADLEKSLDIWPEFVQSWVKIASVHMELGQSSVGLCGGRANRQRTRLEPLVTLRPLSDTTPTTQISTTTEVKVSLYDFSGDESSS